MERTIKSIYCRRAIAFVLMLAVLLGTIPLPGRGGVAYAAQQNSYHDPAEHWMAAVNRTNDEVSY